MLFSSSSATNMKVNPLSNSQFMTDQRNDVDVDEAVSRESKCPDETAHARDSSESVRFAHLRRHSFCLAQPI